MGQACFVLRSTRELLCSNKDAGIILLYGVTYCYEKAALRTYLFLLKELGLCLLEMVFKREMLKLLSWTCFAKKKKILNLIYFFKSAQNNRIINNIILLTIELFFVISISVLYFKSISSITKFLGLIWATALGKKTPLFSGFCI